MKKQASTYYIDEDKPITKAIADLEGACDFFASAAPDLPQADALRASKLQAEYAGDLRTATGYFAKIAKIADDYLINDWTEVVAEIERLDAIRDAIDWETTAGRPVPEWLTKALEG
jgi:hypothetical protein